MANQFKIDHVTISVNVNYQYTDEAGKSTTHPFSDSLQLNFNNETEMNRALTDKSYLAKIVKDVVEKAKSAHDTENKEAKKLLKDLGI